MWVAGRRTSTYLVRFGALALPYQANRPHSSQCVHAHPLSYTYFMHQAAWTQIESIYQLPHVKNATITQFRQLKSSQSFHTKKEGAPHHYCAFFLPYDARRKKIYLCHHIKANDWIPPGGHIEPGETPTSAAVREMKEELRVDIQPSQLRSWNLSVKPINRPDSGCLTHYDVWHLVDVPEQQFDYDPREYYQAAWFDLATAPQQVTKNPDFARLLTLLARTS